MICQICNKKFPTISSLNRHQRTSKCSTASQCNTCKMLYVNLSKHYPDCVSFLKKENEVLRGDNERYILQITMLQDKMENMTHDRLDEIQEQMKELSKKMDEKKEASSVIHIHNNNYNQIQNLNIMKPNDFDSFSEFLTIDHIKKGVYGYAEYAITYPLSNKILCTDFSRRKLKYKTDEGELKTDINLNTLSKDLFKSIDDRNKELIFQYAQEYIEPIKNSEEKMNAYVKFMNYISLIRDGSQGIHHDLYPDFVKQICSLSNS